MHRRQWRDRLYKWLGWVQWAAGVIGVFAAASQKASLPKFQAWSPIAGWCVEHLQPHAWWITVIAFVFVGLCQQIRNYLGPPWVWDAIHSLISAFRDEVFKNVQDPTEDHHRVTLFRYRKWRFWLCRWPWSGWLIAVVRSGHQTQVKRPAFRAHDKSDYTQGVVGRALGRSEWLFVPKKDSSPVLPDVLAVQDDKTLKTYAERTYVTVEWLKNEIHKGKHPAMSFAAIRVKVKPWKAKPWGVIVLDSREPCGILRSRLNAKFSPYGKALAPLLERV